MAIFYTFTALTRLAWKITLKTLGFIIECCFRPIEMMWTLMFIGCIIWWISAQFDSTKSSSKRSYTPTSMSLKKISVTTVNGSK